MLFVPGALLPVAHYKPSRLGSRESCVSCGRQEWKRLPEHLRTAQLTPLPRTASLKNPASTAHCRRVCSAHEPCSSSRDKQRALMALTLLSLVAQVQRETNKAWLQLCQCTNQGERFEKTDGHRSEGRKAAPYGLQHSMIRSICTMPAPLEALYYH